MLDEKHINGATLERLSCQSPASLKQPFSLDRFARPSFPSNKMMGLFGGGSPKPMATPPQKHAGSVCYVTETPKEGSSVPAKRVLSSEQRETVDKIVQYLSEPGYALPTHLKDAKSYWKMAAKKAPEMSRTPTNHSRDGTDHSVMTMADDSSLVELSDREKAYLTTEQIQRCCRAVRWDLKRAVMRVEEILIWRREFGVDNLTGADVEEEAKTGKEYIFGFDKQSRPIHYMHPDRQNTKESPRQIQFVVYLLERTVDLMPAGVENLCLNIDFGSSHGGGQPTSVGQARQVLKILQTYYCERLGRAICIDVPTIFWAFFKVIQPFIDPVTKDKIRFVRHSSETLELVDADQLIDVGYGGEVPFVYDQADYFSKLEKVCLQRRMKLFQNWKALGGKIGESEYAIKTHGEGDKSELKHAEEEAERPRDPLLVAHDTDERSQVPSSSASSVHESPKVAMAGAAGGAELASQLEKTKMEDAPDADSQQLSTEKKQAIGATEIGDVDQHPLVATLPVENNYADPSKDVSSVGNSKTQKDDTESQPAQPETSAPQQRPVLNTANTEYADAPLASPTVLKKAVDQQEQELAYKENMAALKETTATETQPAAVDGVPEYLKRSVVQS